MAKIKASVSVSGTDLVAMREEALQNLGELYASKWTIEEVDLWGEEDLASKAGMLRAWRGSFTATAEIT